MDPYIMTDRATIAATFISRVYRWMSLGLLLSAATAYWAASSEAVINFLYANSAIIWLLIIAELGLVIALSAFITRISADAAAIMFAIYCILTGLTLSSIFLVYDITSIGATFVITAATFGAMSIYGAATKRDLTTMGHVLLMGLVGIIIASIVNIFIGSTQADFVISILGVIVFSGLTAYDTQKLNRLAAGSGDANASEHTKYAIIGALTLYLDFINLFLFLLRLSGRRK